MSAAPDPTPREFLDQARSLLATLAPEHPGRKRLEAAASALAGVDPATLSSTDPRVSELKAALLAARVPVPPIAQQPDPPSREAAQAAAPATTPGPTRPVPIAVISSPWPTYVCVAMSIFVMYAVAQLTIVYNEGASLLAEARVLAAKQPDRRFGQLERQVLMAKVVLFSETSGTVITDQCKGDRSKCTEAELAASGKDELSREAPYVLLHELRDLDAEIHSLESRKNKFFQDVWAPIPVLSMVSAKLGQVWSSLISSPAVAQQRAAISGESPDTNNPQATREGWVGVVTCKPVAPAKDGDKTADVNDEKLPDAQKWVLGMNMLTISQQACDLNLRYTSTTLPSVKDWITQLQTRLDPYALWILPLLYAALGSIVFFMRQLLDPEQPNPEFHRIVHRVALAAMAGIVVGWFWEPAFGRSKELEAVGIGLFTIAFIAGFSIDVFFAFLTRLVKLAEGAVAKLGT